MTEGRSHLALTDRAVDLDERVVRLPGRTLRLTPTECKVLRYLAEQGRPVAAEELLVRVWGYRPGVQSRTAITTIGRLRTKLEPDPKHPRHLVTDAIGAYALVLAPPAAAPVATNLAPERDAFVGRAAEMAALAHAFLGGPGVASLVGTAGAGKTRLATHFALRAGGGWPGGAWFVDLVPVGPGDDVVRAVAQALGLAVTGPDEVLRAVRTRGPLLLVVDNAEHVHDAVAALASRLVASGASVLVTSRAPLEVAGEAVIPVGPMQTIDGVDLLIDRARTQRHLDDDEPARARIAELVEGLDGLPLAIELAAGRLAVLSVRDLIGRLPRRLTVLHDGARPARHATLGAAVASSWEALSDAEQRVLAALGVFAGSFPVDAAEAVVGEPDVAVDALDVLLRRGLVAASPDPSSDATRLRLLLAVRDFARERLDASGEGEGAWRRFRVWAVRTAAEAQAALEGEEARRAQATLVREHHNLAAAARSAPASTEAARIAVALGAGAIRSADRRVLALLGEVAIPSEPSLAVPLLLARGDLAFWTGGDGTADQEAALAIARESGELELEAHAATRRGIQLRFAGRLDESERLLDRASDIGRALGSAFLEARATVEQAMLLRHQGRRQEASDRLGEVAGVLARQGWLRLFGVALGTRGSIERSLGRLDAAERDLRRALEIHERIGDYSNAAILLANLANLCVVDGRIDEAEALCTRALAINRRMGLRRNEAYVLGNLGTVAIGQGRLAEAERLLLESAALHAELDHPLAHGTMLALAGRARHAAGDGATARARYAEAEGVLRAAGLTDRALRVATLSLLADADDGEPAAARAAWSDLRPRVDALPGSGPLVGLVDGWIAGDPAERPALRRELESPAFEQRYLP